MNKSQFIEKLSIKADFTKSDAECLLDAAFELIEASLAQGEEIKFVGFGTFDRLTRKSRSGRNPSTGHSLTIPETRVPRFRPGKAFKNRVAKKRKSSRKSL